MNMHIDRLDHLVLTVADIEVTCAFYQQALGMEVVSFDAGRVALAFGVQKINLHQRGHEFEPKAARPTPGSGDLCFITTVPIQEVVDHVRACGIALAEGPVPRTGAVAALISVYMRDPDGNLIEVANELDAGEE
jgi:catechol 2,3-dioxygenase-like lactoylglutathione lyase family enzyme